MTSATFDSRQAAALHQKLTARTARTGVIGLGYVGLPLAVEFGRGGFSVVGVDVDPRKCGLINSGHSDIPDIPDSAVAELREAGRLVAVTDIGAAGQLDTVNICVPTPLRKTRDPDLSYVAAATQAVKAHLKPGMLVVLESTTYPGTTEEFVRGTLEETGLRAGTDFFLAFSPERVDPGNEKWNTRNVPKVVGGLTPDCAALAAALYEASVDRVVQVSSPRAAEMVKLLENTFRAVNIGLVNEIALMSDRIGVDIWEVIEAASTKPFGFMPFHPGPGLGGHCIPIDPFYLAWKVKEVGLEARFIDVAGQINGAMPLHVVDKIAHALNSRRKAVNGSSILVMGVAYKPGVNDVRESPALEVIGLLRRMGAVVSYHDPFVPTILPTAQTGATELHSEPYSLDAVAEADCVVVLTDHRGIDYAELASRAKLVVDTRNAVKVGGSNVFKLGAPDPTP
jgi:UDP-N-acetyl-D-glucosamine dehydrogenase